MTKYFEVFITMKSMTSDKAYRWVKEEFGPPADLIDYTKIYDGPTRWGYSFDDDVRSHVYRFRDEEDAIQFKLLWG